MGGKVTHIRPDPAASTGSAFSKFYTHVHKKFTKYINILSQDDLFLVQKDTWVFWLELMILCVFCQTSAQNGRKEDKKDPMSEVWLQIDLFMVGKIRVLIFNCVFLLFHCNYGLCHVIQSGLAQMHFPLEHSATIQGHFPLQSENF